MTWLLAKGALGLVRGAWVTIAIIGARWTTRPSWAATRARRTQ